MFVSSSKSQTGKCFCFRNTLHSSWLNKTLYRKAKTQRPVQLSLAAVGRQAVFEPLAVHYKQLLTTDSICNASLPCLFAQNCRRKQVWLGKWPFSCFLLKAQESTGWAGQIWGVWRWCSGSQDLPAGSHQGGSAPAVPLLSTQAACAANSTATLNMRWLKYWAQSCSRHWHARSWHARHSSVRGVKFERVVRCQPASTLELRQSRGSDHVWVFPWSIWWLNCIVKPWSFRTSLSVTWTSLARKDHLLSAGWSHCSLWDASDSSWLSLMLSAQL